LTRPSQPRQRPRAPRGWARSTPWTPQPRRPGQRRAATRRGRGRRCEGGGSARLALAFSPAAPASLAFASASLGLHLYDADAHALWPVSLPGLPAGAPIEALRFRPNGDLTAAAAGITWQIDPSTRAATRLPSPPKEEGEADNDALATDILYAPDDAWALNLYPDRAPRLLRCAPNAPCTSGPRLALPLQPAAAAHFSANSRWLAIAYAATPH
jgi:hypothetical protein